MARHARLQSRGSSTSSPSYFNEKKSFLFGLFGGSGRTPSSASNLTVIKFAKRIASLTAAFFIFSSFSLFDNYLNTTAQGYVDYDEAYENGLSFDEYKNQDVSVILDNMALNDGVILKPNIGNKERDVDESNQTFAYVVEEDDTLASVAERFGVTKETLMMANGMYDAAQFKVGMTLEVLPVDGVIHLVKAGDTVSGIAQKYEIPESDILRQNQLDSENPVIHPDLALIIPGGKKNVTPPKPTYVASSTNSAVASSVPAPTASSYVYDGPPASGTLLWPAPDGCIITQGFHAGHYAIDCANRSGGPIIASEAGVVTKVNAAGWGGGYGLHVIVNNGQGRQTLYAHFSSLNVVEGQSVAPGELLGMMGTTGRSTGIHLHFEVREGSKQNPMNYF